MKKLWLLFVLAFIVRAVSFYYYIQHKERYHQADSFDYHVCALGLYSGAGIVNFRNGWPIFWRTPGYPLYLALFYKLYGVQQPEFEHNSDAQKAALWVQIILSSLTPILVFFLVLSLVPVAQLAWITALIFAFHPGFVLASGYLLTEALGVLLFYAYLIFLYKKYCVVGEGCVTSQPWWYVAVSALFLALYTWMRPMGQFIALVTVFLLFCSALTRKQRLFRALLFATVFVGCLSPWIMRNYHYTGKLFFWPGSGTYLACFNVPKIMRRLTGKTIEQCHKEVMQQISLGIRQEFLRLQKEEPGHYVSQELISGAVALPWVKKYPGYLAADWMREVAKTTFDLYGSQLVNFARNTYTFDPIEEFLGEKLADCLYRQPMHWLMRLLCWLEALFSLFVWVGIACGFYLFFLQPIFWWRTLEKGSFKKAMFFVWFKAGVIIAATLGMTGGFGYARLRMPVEPLMVLLALTAWYYIFYKRCIKAE